MVVVELPDGVARRVEALTDLYGETVEEKALWLLRSALEGRLDEKHARKDMTNGSQMV